MTPKSHVFVRLAGALEEVARELRQLGEEALPQSADPSKCPDVETSNTNLATGEMLNARELAELLRINERTLRRWVHRKKVIRPIRVGNTLRWKRAAIELWMKERAK